MLEYEDTREPGMMSGPVRRRIVVMRMLIGAVALATLIASPAFAQKVTRAQPSAMVVIVNGDKAGQDPDAGVRLELGRDARGWNGAGG
jgi:hypothetical protein